MVKKINSSEFEQVKNNKAIIVDFSVRVVRSMQDACACNGAAF
mgnify:FL=1